MGKYYDNEITPYSDTDIEYDLTKHRYRATKGYADEICKGTTGKSFQVAIGGEAQERFKREELSADMYKGVQKYNRRDEDKRRTTEFLMAKNGDLRDVIKESLGDQIRADLRSGYSMQKDLAWVNPERATVLDLSKVPGVAPDSIEGLLSSGILHKGPYSYSIDDDDYRDDY